MGRMFEALKRAEIKHPRQADAVPAPHLAWPTPAAPARAEEEPEPGVSFIEVGGPRAVIDASPDVLACSPKAGPRLRPVAEPQPALLSVTFRPLPPERTRPEPASRRVAPELIAYHRPQHPVSEQYGTLAGAIAGQLPAARSHVLLFTGLAPEAGTTTVVLNTAITYARQGHLRVAVVDANLGRPAVARRLGLDESPGLRDLLGGNLTLPQALQETALPNLLALTAGAPGRNLADRSPAGALRPVLRQLRERFDLVLLDAPCWEDRPEMVALGAACDAVYLVLPEQQAEAPETRGLVDEVLRAGTRLLGYVLTGR